jgi:transketolase
MATTDPFQLSKAIRCHALRMVHCAKASHIGSCLSSADILAQLYGSFLRVDASNPDWEDRDYFIMSKGHAAAALYAVLCEQDFFPPELLDTYCEDGSPLGGHVSHHVPGVELSTGSLGHGLPVAVGMALGSRVDSRDSRVVALLSDGECDEGSVWEAILIAAHLGLENLLVIVDANELQGLGLVEDVISLEPFADKWSAFGWAVREIDGHDHMQLEEALAAFPFSPMQPSVIIARTLKGKGVSFMEGSLAWHYRSPDAEQLEAALAEVLADKSAGGGTL